VPFRSVIEAQADKKSSVGFQIHKFQFLRPQASHRFAAFELSEKDSCFPMLRLSSLFSPLCTLNSIYALCWIFLGKWLGDLGMWEKIFNFAVQAELRSPGLG
ncbi:MAG: hypothetical protein K2G08_01660, partial [Paramuribaculum sp.]|nr:hypothetical protein [Paramuribaculum sp.]